MRVIWRHLESTVAPKIASMPPGPPPVGLTFPKPGGILKARQGGAGIGVHAGGQGLATSTISFLEDGENILWTGTPPRGLHLTAGDWWLRIPLGLAFILMTLGLVGVAVSRFFDPAAPLWLDAVFVTMALGVFAYAAFVILGPYVRDARRRRSLQYFVTDRRAIILQTLGNEEVLIMPLTDSLEIAVSNGRKGRGTIRFGPRAERRPGPTGPLGLGWLEAEEFVFEGVEGVERVHELLERHRRAA